MARTKQNEIHEFTVEGMYEFPFDMLRYDRCWPKTEASDSSDIGRRSVGFRRITLQGLRPPTEGRWSSFGWKVVS